MSQDRQTPSNNDGPDVLIIILTKDGQTVEVKVADSKDQDRDE